MAATSGLRLSAAEVGRLASLLTGAHLTLDLDEVQRGVPAGPRLAPRLHGTSALLLGRQYQAEVASARLDTPVVVDAPTTAGLLGLLERAAADLEAFADRREHGGYLLGTHRFRELAQRCRAWRADLVELAERQRGRACCERAHPTGRGQGVQR